MLQNISSGASKNIFWKLKNKGLMHFCCDILMGHHKEKNEKKPNYCITKWHTSTPYDIFRNQSTYLTVCLLLYTWHQTDHCITVCGKWILDSNFEGALPLTYDCLNYTCRGNDTGENKFVGVFHVIRSVPPEVVQRRLNMKNSHYLSSSSESSLSTL